jgi:hypothetical protein
MSGGHFQYEQYKISQIADEVEQIIRDNDSTEKDEYGYDKGWHYKPETIEKFKIGLSLLRLAAIAAQRIDWLVSCDDGEDTFHERWDKDFAELALDGQE